MDTLPTPGQKFEYRDPSCGTDTLATDTLSVQEVRGEHVIFHAATLGRASQLHITKWQTMQEQGLLIPASGADEAKAPEVNYGALELKVLLMDTITHLRFKQHLSRGWKVGKQTFCKAAGLPQNITSEKLILHIGKVYEDNGRKDEFNATMTKFKLPQYTL